ncbi:hypothetical protein [uncultured Shimia sp.]|uniref:hypothetical protein n=1 Tax=uncultured Shimia sp. TaxID=573152 RepID=UPI0026130DB2|nr:hypothetical protein [uncultured Shimia sp.]
MQRAFWLSFITAAAIYLTMALWSVPFIADQAAGQAPFDMRPMGYSLSDAKGFLGALTEDGRAFYLDVQQKLDIAYPALLGLALVLGLQLALRPPWGTVFGLVALMATAADYFENHIVAGMLQTPLADLDSTTVQVASFLTMSKSLGHMTCFVALLLGASTHLMRRALR